MLENNELNRNYITKIFISELTDQMVNRDGIAN